ncbi:hypothetical protein BXZ70DRAFT_339380 [Cristinia sonorae]|uniref:Uncharacterized protein n=1 Tax=Cristinia sonorae TaxID=1940300 RepID=A0A8K0XN22_9AGAR|nr:hypothetical protein BXZ70DRAFT_339380 [Cristinia sonorae]
MTTRQNKPEADVTSNGKPSRNMRRTNDSYLSSASNIVEGGKGDMYNAPSSSMSIDAPKIASQPSQMLRHNDQSCVIDVLVKMGIKVRDFAYESTLPPISSVPQFVGGLRSLKREREAYEEEDKPFAGTSRSTAKGTNDTATKKAKGLARELTEPVVPQPNSDQTALTRHTGFLQFGPSLSTLNPDRNHSNHPITPRRQHAFPMSPLSRTPLAAPSWISASQRDPESQDSETWIDTPLATPVASQQWRVIDTSAIPASQLDSNSQQPVPEDVTLSQLGFTLEPSQQYSQDAGPSPTTSPPHRPSTSMLPRNQTPPRDASSSAPVSPPRYDFRDRGDPCTSPLAINATRPRSHSRDKRSTSLSPSRHSSQPRSPPRTKGKRVSQSARPLRRSARNAGKIAEPGALLS